jgi:hypothetical protein
MEYDVDDANLEIGKMRAQKINCGQGFEFGISPAQAITTSDSTP